MKDLEVEYFCREELPRRSKVEPAGEEEKAPLMEVWGFAPAK